MGPYEQYLRAKGIAEPDPEPRPFGHDMELKPITNAKGRPLFAPRPGDIGGDQ